MDMMNLFHVSADESEDDPGCFTMSVRFGEGVKEMFVGVADVECKFLCYGSHFLPGDRDLTELVAFLLTIC